MSISKLNQFIMECSVCDITRDIGNIKRDLAKILVILEQDRRSVSPPIPKRHRIKAIISDDESDSESNDYEPDEPPKLSSSPHCGVIGKVRLHVTDGPYMIGDPLSIGDISTLDFDGNHYVRWMVWSTDSTIIKHCTPLPYDSPTCFFCDWSPQIVDSNSENQRDCAFRWGKYGPLAISGDEGFETFTVAPLFYSYHTKELLDMTDVKVSR